MTSIDQPKIPLLTKKWQMVQPDDDCPERKLMVSVEPWANHVRTHVIQYKSRTIKFLPRVGRSKHRFGGILPPLANCLNKKFFTVTGDASRVVTEFSKRTQVA